MCGFVGAWRLSGRGGPPSVARSSLDALHHRGPDSGEWYVDTRCTLGFRRLAIIDREGGDQPLANEDGRVVIAVNGEIYNHHALRDELIGGHRFRTAVDAEVALHGYEEWGEHVLPRLRGMFALVLLDQRQGSLLLARDHVGKKPLYYTISGGVLRFSSEIRPLLEGGAPPIDRLALNDYLRFGYVPAPRTLFAGISKLPAGCLLSADEHGRVEVRRWSPLLLRCPTTGRGEGEWAEAIRESLAAAVAVRLESEVPLGFLLSGGIDSAAVFALGAQALGDQQAHAFTIGFDEGDVDETAAAAEVARRYGARHTVRLLRREEAPDLAASVARCEEPLATDALLPTDRVFAAVRQAGITTILAGEGADEIFAGYAKFASACGWRGGDPGAWLRSGASPLERYLSSEEFCFPQLAERRALLGDAATDEGYGWLDGAVEGLDPLSQMLAIEVALRLPDRINLRLDRLSMAHSIEARAPFMDRSLMELALQVPHNLRVRPGAAKWILRRALRQDLPDVVLNAPKAPFRAPDAWFVEGVTAPTSAQVAEAGLVRLEAVEALRLGAARDRGMRERLYNLTVLHLWHRHWYGSGEGAGRSCLVDREHELAGWDRRLPW